MRISDWSSDVCSSDLASPSTDSLDFYLDTKKVNSKLIGLGDSINYVEAFIGDRVAEIKRKDGGSIFKESIKLEKDKAYSLFITNEKDKDDAEYVQKSGRATCKERMCQY